MNINLLVLPVVNKLAVFRMKAPPDNKIPIAVTVNILRNFTNHMDGDKRPLIRTFVDPADDVEGGLIGYLDGIVENGKEKWSAEWGLKEKGKKGEYLLDYHEEKTDQEIARLLFGALKELLKDDKLKIPKNSKLEKARIILVAGEVEEVKTAINDLDEKAIIGLEYTDHQQWVTEIIALRAWKLLKTTKNSLLKAESALKSSNKSRDEWKSRAENAEKALNEKAKEVHDIEIFLSKEGGKIFEKALESQGYILPTRRVCQICDDKKRHNEEHIPPDMMNQYQYVEERCALFSTGQQCQQCAASPPSCFSNEKVQNCKRAKEDPCQTLHYGKIPAHTAAIHNLEDTRDKDLMKRLVNKYGECNFPEYLKFADNVVEIDEGMF